MRLASPIRAACAAAVLLLAAACRDGDAGSSPAARADAERQPGGELDPLFARAGREFGVPADLLKSIAYVETRFQMVRGGEELPGLAPAFGVMALRGERLARGAGLAGVSEEAARATPEANVRAAAALLRAYADEAGVADRGDAGAWAPAVARYSGIESREGQAQYVHRDVYAALAAGLVARGPGGTLVASVLPTPARPTIPVPAAPLAAVAPDYPLSNTVWRPSPNYNARPAGDIGRVAMVIIHTCEGSYTGCVNTLLDPARQASAHYVVNESGSEISQLVRESDRAWHIAATYDCALNASVDCWRNGYSSNHFTVGIEHGGYASQASFPAGQLDASAKLSCDIAKAHAVPRDRQHFVGHGQLQPYNRTDPGPNWPWTDYMGRIATACGAGAIIIDSNNGSNNTAQGYIEVSANWTSSANVAGYYGTGYYVASTQAVSDPATFWFYLPAAATRTVDAWWTAAGDRSTTAPFIAYDAAGTKLATVSVNQQLNGGRWNALGSFAFSAGWNRVQLSRWTTAGAVVVADAVRVR